MKTNTQLISAIFLCAVLFVFLFYKQNIGFNLLIFEAAIIGLLFHFKRFAPNTETLVLLSGTIISVILVVIHNSDLSIFINILSLILLTGKLLYPVGGSLLFALGFAGPHLVSSQLTMLKMLNEMSSKKPRIHSLLNWLRITLISIVLIVLFVLLYKSANPVFSDLISGITTSIEVLFNNLFKNIDFQIIITFLFGLGICDFLLIKTGHKKLEAEVNGLSNQLIRKKIPLKSNKLSMQFKREWKAALGVLFILNVILLTVNVIDIYWVWFNFEWDGDYLKQFVHEGTYMLIISIITSVMVSLYLFRGNLNYFHKSQSIKILTYIWLVQNVVLAFSVAIRNFHYIHYYALAYKRIGVFFFLAATIIGLITVLIKIKHLRSIHFLVKTNALSVYIILVFMATVNWDIAIARYNFSHAGRSFVHFDFLIGLSDNALPYMDKNLDELLKIEEQNARFPSKIEYLSAEEFRNFLDQRIVNFKSRHQNSHWLSWNYASQDAFNQLNNQQAVINSQ